jgi:hypothetical protein
MNTQPPPTFPLGGEQPPRSFRSSLWASLQYWEPRRVVYNFALAAVTVGWVIASWPHFRPALTLSSLFPLLGLVLVANLCYCAAYIVDIPLQLSSLAVNWRKYRWLLWSAGMLFAIVLASYWINDEIYPDFH